MKALDSHLAKLRIELENSQRSPRKKRRNWLNVGVWLIAVPLISAANILLWILFIQNATMKDAILFYMILVPFAAYKIVKALLKQMEKSSLTYNPNRHR